jgi:hypothetical protein
MAYPKNLIGHPSKATRQESPLSDPKLVKPRFLLAGSNADDLADVLSGDQFNDYDARAMTFINGHFFVLMQIRGRN